MSDDDKPGWHIDPASGLGAPRDPKEWNALFKAAGLTLRMCEVCGSTNHAEHDSPVGRARGGW